jgi:DNA polymerase III delta prime subunit
MVIHLNASDERGIDIIRNQIYQFVKSNNFFDVGLKFVILDEVDYMTKNAQQALKFLLQNSFYNVRFCLICNYISKIDESLKNEFICVRFNQLPKEDIFNFIKYTIIIKLFCSTI